MFKFLKNPRAEKGQSLVELAISMSLIIMLLIGAVDFGMAFFSWVAIRDASQEGAIYAAVCPSDPGDPDGTLMIENRIRSVSSTPVDLTDASRVRIFIAPTVDPSSPSSADLGGAGTPVTVLVEFDYQSITPVAASFIGDNGFLTLRASTTNTILTTTNPNCD